MAAPERFAKSQICSCNAGTVHTWPFSAAPTVRLRVRCWGRSCRTSHFASRQLMTSQWTLAAKFCCAAQGSISNPAVVRCNSVSGTVVSLERYRMKRILVAIALITLIASTGWAQQPTVAPAQQETSQADNVRLAPGRYLGMIFGWWTTVTVASIDMEGQIHGRLTSCPNAIRRQYGVQCAIVDFNTERGEDGLPEHIAPRPITNDSGATNDYTRIKACGENLCIRVSRMIGREDGKGDERVEVNITLVKQAGQAEPETEQPSSLAPPGFAPPGTPLMPPGASPTQVGRPPLQPPGFAPSGMPPMLPGASPRRAGSPPLPPTIPPAPAGSIVTPLSPN